MKGMDMMATRGVMPLGAEQANVLLAPAIANEGQNMSFAKSFGEVAASAAGTTLAGQMLKENTAPIAKGTDAPVGMIEKLLYISIGDGLKETSSPTSTALAKISDARVAGAQSQSSGKLGNVSGAVSVVDGNTVTLQNAEINVSTGATPVSNENPVGPIVDAAGNQEAPGAKIDSIPLQLASKVVQPVSTGNEGQPVVQKKEVVWLSWEVGCGEDGKERTEKFFCSSDELNECIAAG